MRCMVCNDKVIKYAERSKCWHRRQKSKCRECDGSSFCTHRTRKSRCKECGGTSICIHGRIKSTCRKCDGSAFCTHGRRKNTCKICNDPIDVTIKHWILHCRQSDKKNNRFDTDHFIDTDFLRGLVEDYEYCYYDDCKVKLQFMEYRSDLGTIERLNNSIGHVKSNCVLCCKNCNNKKKSNGIVKQQVDS